MILIIDNYDSFTHNLVQYVGEMGKKIEVYRNDKLNPEELRKLNPERIIISPGPKTPLEAGMSNDIIKQFHKDVPMLGVCLGHQCIAYVFGAEIVEAERLMHGKQSLIYHDRKTIYRNLPNPFPATRYHSLIIKESTLPASLEVTARSEYGEIMGIRHKDYPLEGVQFHPESILTKEGKALLRNFIFQGVK